jgi:hypothetical protein
MAAMQDAETISTSRGEPPATGGSLAESFVVRLWQPPERSRDGRDALRGVVQHVRSGRSTTFMDGGGLLTFLDEERRVSGSAGGAP